MAPGLRRIIHSEPSPNRHRRPRSCGASITRRPLGSGLWRLEAGLSCALAIPGAARLVVLVPALSRAPLRLAGRSASCSLQRRRRRRRRAEGRSGADGGAGGSAVRAKEALRRRGHQALRTIGEARAPAACRCDLALCCHLRTAGWKMATPTGYRQAERAQHPGLKREAMREGPAPPAARARAKLRGVLSDDG